MPVKKGDKVKVDYTGMLEDGTVFETTSHKEHSHPMEFVAGEGNIIPGFDSAIMGMEKGEEKEVTIPCEEGYGKYDPKLAYKVPRDQVPGAEGLSSGRVILVELPDGQQVPVTIKSITDSFVELDMNHPLAGKTLRFRIRVSDIDPG